MDVSATIKPQIISSTRVFENAHLSVLNLEQIIVKNILTCGRLAVKYILRLVKKQPGE